MSRTSVQRGQDVLLFSPKRKTHFRAMGFKWADQFWWKNITTFFAAYALGTLAPTLTIYQYKRIPIKIAQYAPSGCGVGKSENGLLKLFTSTYHIFFSHLS